MYVSVYKDPFRFVPFLTNTNQTLGAECLNLAPTASQTSRRPINTIRPLLCAVPNVRTVCPDRLPDIITETRSSPSVLCLAAIIEDGLIDSLTIMGTVF
ncbi:hypothetical protein ACOMHN_029289 [Nucella lapillus]